MGFKARELEGMSKAELIKALRASVAREAKLQKRIAALAQDNVLRASAQKGPPKPDAQFIADVDEGARLALHGDLEPEDQAPPAFPWDVK